MARLLQARLPKAEPSSKALAVDAELACLVDAFKMQYPSYNTKVRRYLQVLGAWTENPVTVAQATDPKLWRLFVALMAGRENLRSLQGVFAACRAFFRHLERQGYTVPDELCRYRFRPGPRTRARAWYQAAHKAPHPLLAEFWRACRHRADIGPHLCVPRRHCRLAAQATGKSIPELTAADLVATLEVLDASYAPKTHAVARSRWREFLYGVARGRRGWCPAAPGHPQMAAFAARRRAEGFASDYAKCLNFFLRWLTEHRPAFRGFWPHQVPLTDLREDDLEAYQHYLKERQSAALISPRTLSFYLHPLRLWLRYLHEERVIVPDLSRCLRVPYPEVCRRRSLPLPVLVPLLEAIERQSAHPARDPAFFSLQLGLGLRFEEVYRLQVGDVDWEQACLAVRGKGGRPRYMPLPPVLLWILKRYLAVRPPGQTERFFVFAGKRGRPLARTSAYHELHRVFTRALGEVTTRKVGGPHALRHTFATELHRQGVKEAEILELMGLSSFKTLSKYVVYGQAEAHRDFLEKFRI